MFKCLILIFAPFVMFSQKRDSTYAERNMAIYAKAPNGLDQWPMVRDYLKESGAKDAAGLGLIFASGFARGFKEALGDHYGAVKRVFPNLNDQFWDPSKSWKNKYADYDNGVSAERFPLSTTVLVGATDGRHLLGTIERAGMIGGTFVFCIDGKKRSKGYWVKKFIAATVVNMAGFTASYTVLFHK